MQRKLALTAVLALGLGTVAASAVAHDPAPATPPADASADSDQRISDQDARHSGDDGTVARRADDDKSRSTDRLHRRTHRMAPPRGERDTDTGSGGGSGDSSGSTTRPGGGGAPGR